ncbi:MAG: DNRLRE domain-containing protein [Verrucomicrobiae bacterium]|nr:DNRLRE domain-containing protein [Verrucomicrobiae bacterium]
MPEGTSARDESPGWHRATLSLLLVGLWLSGTGCSAIRRLVCCPEEPRRDCCTSVAQTGRIEGRGTEWVSLWITAYKDTYVDRREPDRRFGCEPDVRVASLLVEPVPVTRRTYVHFVLPRLPAGSQIGKAFLNLYNPDFSNPPENAPIHARTAVRHWDPCDLTWNNQPEEPGFLSSADFGIKYRNRDWCGPTASIRQFIEPIFANAAAHEGFIIFTPVQPSQQKAFLSNNHSSRTANDLGLAPRLLVRVKLPPGTTAADIRIPPLPADNDLGALGVHVLLVAVADAADDLEPFPAAWNVFEGP